MIHCQSSLGSLTSKHINDTNFTGAMYHEQMALIAAYIFCQGQIHRSEHDILLVIVVYLADTTSIHEEVHRTNRAMTW